MKTNETSDAYQAISQFSGWVANADTKAGLLTTATTLVGGGLVGQRAAIRASLRPRSAVDWAGVATVSVSVLALLVTTFALVAVLLPRSRHQRFSRFSWPAVARTPMDELLVEVDSPATYEAWWTARDLALIARRKFRWLRVALFGWAVGAFALVTWMVAFH